MTATAQRAPGGGAIAARPPAPGALWAIALARASPARGHGRAGADHRAHDRAGVAGGAARLDRAHLHGRRRRRLVAPPRQPLRAADGRRGRRDVPVLALLRRRRRRCSRSGRRSTSSPRRSSCTSPWPIPAAASAASCERAIVAVAYACAVGLQVVNMTLGNYGPDNLLEVTQDPDAGLSSPGSSSRRSAPACSPASWSWWSGGGRRAGRGASGSPCSSTRFALALVMIAFLFTNGAWGKVAFPWVQRATLFVIGLAPVAFLIGLLEARLARSSVGDLLVDLRAEPSPRELRDALARTRCATPSLELAYWLPEFGGYADLEGREVGAAATPRRGAPSPHIDRDGATRRGARPRPVAARRPPAARGRRRRRPASPIENTRLQVELRARLEELEGSRAARDRGGPAASASASSATCTTAPSSA